MNKVLVIGNGGSGKSTFSKRLSARLGLPLVHLDGHYWRPGWSATPKEEWLLTVERLVGAERWVMDGNYGGTMRRRMEAADTIIYLDVSRVTCILGVLKRRIFGKRADEIPGCRERLDLEFLKWIWNYPRKNRPTILRLLEEFRSSKRVIVLRSRNSVHLFSSQLESDTRGRNSSGPE